MPRLGGRVREVVARSNEQVGAGDPLVVVEVIEAEPRVTQAPRADFAVLAPDRGASLDHEGCAHRLEEVRCMLLGFDVTPPTRRHSQRNPMWRRLAQRGTNAVAVRTRSLLCSSTWQRCSVACPSRMRPTSGGSRVRSTSSRISETSPARVAACRRRSWPVPPHAAALRGRDARAPTATGTGAV